MRFRTLLWVFLLDSAFAMFNNVTPRLVLKEMKMDIACPEACFQADSAEECFTHIQTWISRSHRQKPIPFSSFIRSFCGGEMDIETQINYASHAFVNMSALVSGKMMTLIRDEYDTYRHFAAFHVMIFNLDPVCGAKSQFRPLFHGISNWKAVWNRRIFGSADNSIDVVISPSSGQPLAEVGNTSWKRAGVWKHAAEFWLLSQIYLDRMASSQQGLKANDHLLQPDNPSCEVEPRVRGEYDDTNMNHLHTFISNFEGLKIA